MRNKWLLMAVAWVQKLKLWDRVVFAYLAAFLVMMAGMGDAERHGPGVWASRPPLMSPTCRVRGDANHTCEFSLRNATISCR